MSSGAKKGYWKKKHGGYFRSSNFMWVDNFHDILLYFRIRKKPIFFSVLKATAWLKSILRNNSIRASYLSPPAKTKENATLSHSLHSADGRWISRKKTTFKDIERVKLVLLALQSSKNDDERTKPKSKKLLWTNGRTRRTCFPMRTNYIIINTKNFFNSQTFNEVTWF